MILDKVIFPQQITIPDRVNMFVVLTTSTGKKRLVYSHESTGIVTGGPELFLPLKQNNIKLQFIGRSKTEKRYIVL